MDVIKVPVRALHKQLIDNLIMIYVPISGDQTANHARTKSQATRTTTISVAGVFCCCGWMVLQDATRWLSYKSNPSGRHKNSLLGNSQKYKQMIECNNK